MAAGEAGLVKVESCQCGGIHQWSRMPTSHPRPLLCPRRRRIDHCCVVAPRRFQEGGELDHIPVARHTDFRSYLDRAFPGDFADELHVLIAVGIKELGGEEPEGAQLAPDGTGDFEDHEAWKWGRGIDGAGKNIASWTGMMKK